MQMTSKEKPSSNAIGLFLDFVRDDGDSVTMTITDKDPYRRKVTVAMPAYLPNQLQQRRKCLQEFICKLREVQPGGYTVRIDWQNAREFFSLEDIRMMDRLDRFTSYQLYGISEKDQGCEISNMVEEVCRNHYNRTYKRKNK